MTNINNIVQPVLNGRTRESRKFKFEEKGFTQITISVNADRDLTLNLYQSYNGENFDKVDTENYLASDGNKLFTFDKQGVIFYFELVNTSGADCTYTRAFGDFIISESTSTTISEVSDSQTHNKLDTVNNDLSNINNTLTTLIEEKNSIYSLKGKNNEFILDTNAGQLIYADSVPVPVSTASNDNKEGWFYTNTNQGNKFNYYYFSNTGYNLTANNVKGQYAIFENQAITTDNVNVLLAIYTGNFFTGGRRVYTSNQRIEPGVKYLVYWGENPNIFKELPRIEYTLASERNWDNNAEVLTMSVGSDSGYTAGTIANLMTHIGYIDNNGPITSRLISSKNNINTGGQLVNITRDLNTNTSNIITLVNTLTESMNTGFNLLANKLQELIELQSGNGGNGGGGGGGGGGNNVELRSIIPDTDPEGNPISTGGELQVFTWGFTTGEATQYDLYAATNNFVIGDNETIFTMYLANDLNETSILDPTNFFSKNDEEITMTLVNDDYIINFSNQMTGETAQAEITLLTNTTYIFKISTLFNDDDETNPDVRLGITLQGDTSNLELNYISVV